jgi:hypothetical protein
MNTAESMQPAIALPRVPTVADRSMLVDAWKAATTEREKARIEELLWMSTGVSEREALRDEGKANHGRYKWIMKLVDAPEYDVACRARLSGGNPDIDELWSRVEKKEFSIGMAMRKLMDARKVRQRDNISLREAVSRLLAEYDTWPKRREGMYMIGIKPSTSFSRVRVNEKKRKASPNDDREFWMRLRELLQGFVHRRTTGAPPHIQETLISEFERELKVVTASWSSKLDRAKNRNADNAVLLVTRAKVTKACGVLNMDPPKPGKPADMKLAQSRKRTLAKTYHPDVSPHTRDQYEAVLEAFSVLEDYEEMLKSGGGA